MATIRPTDLPAAASVASGDALIVDKGSAVEKATPAQIVDAAIPLASQAESEAGTDNAKRVTPLRVKQAIEALGISETKLAATGESEGAALVGFLNSRTAQNKLEEAPISLYDAPSFTVAGDCIAAMDWAIARAISTGNPVIQVPDGVTLGQHIIDGYADLTIRGGKNVTFDSDVDAAGFLAGSGGRLTITGFRDAVLKTHPTSGGDIDNAHVFFGLNPLCEIDELHVTDNSISGGRMGISAGFEGGRVLNRLCTILRNVCSNQNGSDGGEGYGIHYANENDFGNIFLGWNTVIEAGRHSFYLARNQGGGSINLIGNVSLDHRKNSPTQGLELRVAFAFFRCSNVTSFGDKATGFYDGAIGFGEEAEDVVGALNCDNVKIYGFSAKAPANTVAAVWFGYTDPSATATVNNILMDGFSFDSSLENSNVVAYSWGRGIKMSNTQIVYRGLDVGARMFVISGNSDVADIMGRLTFDGITITLIDCAGSFSIMRPTAPHATSNVPLAVRDVEIASNNGGATIVDWEPTVTITNTEIEATGFSFPSAATSKPKSVPNPSGLTWADVPATAGASGTEREIAWDGSYLYVCTATDTWKRAALATW